MAKENSFDIVSKTDYAELTTLSIRLRKRFARFDFKGSKAAAELMAKTAAKRGGRHEAQEYHDILQSKLLKRGISLKASIIKRQSAREERSAPRKGPAGHPDRQSKRGRQFIKDINSRYRPRSRARRFVFGQGPRHAQEVIAALKGHDFGIDMTYDNFVLTDRCSFHGGS